MDGWVDGRKRTCMSSGGEKFRYRGYDDTGKINLSA